MKTKVFIQNLKCEGCVKSIKSALSSIDGITVTSVNNKEGYIEFNQEKTNLQILVLNMLRGIGYPPKDDYNSIGLKAKSIISCINGRLKNKVDV